MGARKIAAAGTTIFHKKKDKKTSRERFLCIQKMSQQLIKNESDWRAWLKKNGARLLFYARQWTNSYADAEDVLQEAFVRFWKHQKDLEGSTEALLVTSIRRTAIDLGRSRSRRINRETTSYEMNEKSVSPEFNNNDENAILDAAIQKLPREQREVLAMKIWGELTFDEIATELEISQNTAASRYRYALEALRRILKPEKL